MDGYRLKDVFSIEKILNLHYTTVKNAEKIIAGNFYALIYSDFGEITVCAKDKTYLLKSGFALFLTDEKEFTLSAEKRSDVFIALFYTSSPLVPRFDGKTFAADAYKKTLLAQLIAAGRVLFERTAKANDLPQKRDDAGASVEQVVKNCLELFVIDCVKPLLKKTATGFINPLDENEAMKITEKINAFLGDRIEKQFTLEELSDELYFSVSYLKTAYRKTTGKSIKQAFREMKIQEAKRLLRSGLSVSEISDRLAFCNKNYFYKVFSQETGMTPSGYKNSLKGD